MSRFIAHAAAADFAALAAELSIPVLLADAQIHRRIAVHYLWFPGKPSPEIHREIPHVLQSITGQDWADLAIVLDAAGGRLRFFRVSVSQQP